LLVESTSRVELHTHRATKEIEYSRVELHTHHATKEKKIITENGQAEKLYVYMHTHDSSTVTVYVELKLHAEHLRTMSKGTDPEGN
jgi:hypothetical protein